MYTKVLPMYRYIFYILYRQVFNVKFHIFLFYRRKSKKKLLLVYQKSSFENAQSRVSSMWRFSRSLIGNPYHSQKSVFTAQWTIRLAPLDNIYL